MLNENETIKQFWLLLLVLLFEQNFVVWVWNFRTFLMFEINFKAIISKINLERLI